MSLCIIRLHLNLVNAQMFLVSFELCMKAKTNLCYTVFEEQAMKEIKCLMFLIFAFVYSLILQP